MFDALKRLIKGPSAAGGARHALEIWCASRSLSLRGVKQSEGFVVDGMLGLVPWRLEWGPSQRRYVKGFELRLRAEPGLAAGLQALVLDRPLQQEMEREVFEEFVEDTKTRIDTSTPPEMRWLVMLQKLSADASAEWRSRFYAVANDPQWASRWLAGQTGTRLHEAPLSPGQPMVLMVHRGRITLRTAMDMPESADLERWVGLFEAAVASAVEASQGV